MDKPKTTEPKPPLTRYIVSGIDFLFEKGNCELCGSSLMREHYIYGKIKCIHPQCKNNSKSA